MTSGNAVLIKLPPYSWHHEAEHWNESRTVRKWCTRKIPRHELLGIRVLEDNELGPIWRNEFRIEDVPWVSDHKIVQDIVFPPAGYIAMAGEAIR